MKTARIGAIDYQLSRDYDRGNFGPMDLNGKVEYMRLRVNRFLLEPCGELLRVSDHVQVGLIVPTVLCAGISAASTFQHGRQPDKKAKETDSGFFLAFVATYMDAALQNATTDPNEPRVMTFADWMYYRLRNGLAHSFTIEYGGSERGQTQYVAMGPREPMIDLGFLLKDFDRGWHRLLNNVLANPAAPLATNFSQRFSAIFRD